MTLIPVRLRPAQPGGTDWNDITLYKIQAHITQKIDLLVANFTYASSCKFDNQFLTTNLIPSLVRWGNPPASPNPAEDSKIRRTQETESKQYRQTPQPQTAPSYSKCRQVWCIKELPKPPRLFSPTV